MTRRKRSPRRRGRYRRFFKKSKPKIPLEVAVTGVSLPFVPVADGWNTPYNYVTAGDFQGLGMGLTKAFTGIDISGGGTNLLSIVNPFDMNSARYTKMLLLAGLMSRVRKRFIHIPFEKIPIVGRYIS